MKDILIYPAGITRACACASAYLDRLGLPVVDHPTPEVTHLLLDAPVRNPQALPALLERIPERARIAGGNLPPPSAHGHAVLDLLRDEGYLAQNAAITAECALQLASGLMDRVFSGSGILILGWGRIGKCLARLLCGLGARVTVAARRDADRAMLTALGYHAADYPVPGAGAGDYRLIFNTVPAPVALPLCHCPVIDLATASGLCGEAVIAAGGLPEKYAPESSGVLIAETLIRLIKEESP